MESIHLERTGINPCSFNRTELQRHMKNIAMRILNRTPDPNKFAETLKEALQGKHVHTEKRNGKKEKILKKNKRSKAALNLGSITLQ